MTLTYHALWMLCALGAAVFAAGTPAGVRPSAALATGFAAAALLTSGSSLPDAVWTGGLAAVAAAAYLFKPRLQLVAIAIGGALGGLWSALLEVQGLPVVVALIVAAGLVIVSLRLSRTRAGFATEALTQEGLLAIGVLGLGVAMLPGVLDGWQAATNLSGAQEQRATAPASIPMWTLVLLLASTSLGALHSVWGRR